MRFRFFLLFLLAGMLIITCATAEGLSLSYVPEVIYPGKAERITLSLSAEAEATLDVLNAQGETVHTIRSRVSLKSGDFTTTFNGCILQGAALPAGEYTLRVQANGETVTQKFRIGAAAPQIQIAALDAAQYELGSPMRLSLTASAEGTLNALLISTGGTAQQVLSAPVATGANAFAIPTEALPFTGDCFLSLTLTDGDGLSSNTYQLPLSLALPVTPSPVPTATPLPTPRPQPTVRPALDAEETLPGDYWTMELGNYDWQAIWQVMISPMTVISGSGKEAEKQTYKLRATPDKTTGNGNVLGEITCETQGVHVLETREDGWTYVEAYNSSYGEAYRRAGKGAGYGKTNELIRGYVESSRLKIFTPRTEYGLLIDKMTQELYIVNEGGLVSTLLISTGLTNSAQPWNETPAGEYYLSSKVGDFPSGNLICAYGMRFNNGDILHQVPYILNEKYNIKDFSSTEKRLGEKASHGCVRVQRKENADGLNMKWLWDNVPLKTKLIIWDEAGRPEPYMEYPVSADTVLYYNPTGGKYYHADPNCSSINKRYLPLAGSLTYAQLDDPEYTFLTPCKHCNPPALRKSEVDAFNAANGY